MQTENQLFNDLGKLATGAAGIAQSIREEIETLMRQRLERAIADLDVVPRDEFEVVKAMAAAAREENEVLKERVAALEAKLDN